MSAGGGADGGADGGAGGTGAAAISALPAAARDPLAWAATIAFLLLAVAVTTTMAPMSVASGLCALLTLVTFLRTPRPRWPDVPVNRAALAWLAAIVIASAFAVPEARGFSWVNKGFLPALVGLAALHGSDRATGRRALALYLGAAGLADALALVPWWQHGHGYAWRSGGLSGHYMTYGGQTMLEFPVAFAVLLFARSARWRWGAGAVALVSLVALATTFTRSSWMGAFVAVLLVVAARWPLGVLVPAVVASALWRFAPGDWGARLHSMIEPHSGYNGERLLMWQAGWKMFRDHPLTGVGTQNMHDVYARYALPEAREKVRHLHNTYVMVAASMGAVGLAAFAWLYSALVRTAGPGWPFVRGFTARLREGGEGAALRVGVTAALAGFLVAGCFEWNFGDEELLMQLYVLVGLAWASRHWADDAPAADAAGTP